MNLAGGQPVSMQNARELKALCDRHGIPVMMDATRAVENAYFIQQREPGYADKKLAEILHEFCSYTDGCTMSGKKDALVNIGGWLALNDHAKYEEASNLVVVYEGLHTYGGMAGRDMEAMARGIEESVDDDYMRSRIGQVIYLGQKLLDWGVPIVQPVGGHAVFLDAARSTRISRRTSSPRRPWLPISSWKAASGRWSAASCPQAVIPPPAIIAIPSWNWCV